MEGFIKRNPLLYGAGTMHSLSNKISVKNSKFVRSGKCNYFIIIYKKNINL